MEFLKGKNIKVSERNRLRQWRGQNISEGGAKFRHKSTLGEVPKARPF